MAYSWADIQKFFPKVESTFDGEGAQRFSIAPGDEVKEIPGLGSIKFMVDESTGRVVPSLKQGDGYVALSQSPGGSISGAPIQEDKGSFIGGALKDVLTDPKMWTVLGGGLLANAAMGAPAAAGLGDLAAFEAASASVPNLWGTAAGAGAVGAGAAGYTPSAALTAPLTSGASATSGFGLNPATAGIGLQAPASLGGTATGLGLDSALAGAGFTSGLSASSPGLAAMLDPVASGLGSAGVASGATSAAVPGATGSLSSLAGPAGAAGAPGLKTAADLFKPISEWGADDWLSALGKAAPGLIGAYASNEQAGALSDLAKQQMDAESARYDDLVRRETDRFNELKSREDAAIARQNEYMKLGMSREDARFAELKERENEAIARQRGDIEYGRAQTQPYRTRLSELYANPDSFLTSNEVTKPVQMGTDMLARSLSVGGNPIGSGNALQQLQSYSADQLFSRLGEEKNRLGTLGGMGSFGQSGASILGTGTSLPSGTSTPVPGIGSSLPSFANAGSNIGTNAGSNLSLASLESGSNVWNSLGAAANNVFTPQKTLAQQLAELKQAGVF